MTVEFVRGQFVGTDTAQVTMSVDDQEVSDAATGENVFHAMAAAIAKTLGCDGKIRLTFCGVEFDLVKKCYAAKAGLSGDGVAGGFWPISVSGVLAEDPVVALGQAMTQVIAKYAVHETTTALNSVSAVTEG